MLPPVLVLISILLASLAAAADGQGLLAWLLLWAAAAWGALWSARRLLGLLVELTRDVRRLTDR